MQGNGCRTSDLVKFENFAQSCRKLVKRTRTKLSSQLSKHVKSFSFLCVAYLKSTVQHVSGVELALWVGAVGPKSTGLQFEAVCCTDLQTRKKKLFFLAN